MTDFGQVETEDDIKLVAGGYIAYIISHTALQAAALTGNTPIFTAAAGEEITGCLVEPTIAFVGTGIVTYTVEVGFSGDENLYKSAFDVTQTANQGLKTGLDDVPSWSGTTAILLTGRSTGANTDQSTAGSVTVYIKSDKVI